MCEVYGYLSCLIYYSSCSTIHSIRLYGLRFNMSYSHPFLKIVNSFRIHHFHFLNDISKLTKTLTWLLSAENTITSTSFQLSTLHFILFRFECYKTFERTNSNLSSGEPIWPYCLKNLHIPENRAKPNLISTRN